MVCFAPTIFTQADADAFFVHQDLMTKTLTTPCKVSRKLVQGATERGMSVASLLTFVSELLVAPDRPTEQDQQRSECIESLLERFRAGQLGAQDAADLDQLIAATYRVANSRAARLSRPNNIAAV